MSYKQISILFFIIWGFFIRSPKLNKHFKYYKLSAFNIIKCRNYFIVFSQLLGKFTNWMRPESDYCEKIHNHPEMDSSIWHTAKKVRMFTTTQQMRTSTYWKFTLFSTKASGLFNSACEYVAYKYFYLKGFFLLFSDRGR